MSVVERAEERYAEYKSKAEAGMDELGPPLVYEAWLWREVSVLVGVAARAGKDGAAFGAEGAGPRKRRVLDGGRASDVESQAAN